MTNHDIEGLDKAFWEAWNDWIKVGQQSLSDLKVFDQFRERIAQVGVIEFIIYNYTHNTGASAMDRFFISLFPYGET